MLLVQEHEAVPSVVTLSMQAVGRMHVGIWNVCSGQ